jgi:hypothetical protein
MAQQLQDFTLTADHRNPFKNRALTRVRQMSPDELYSAGYRHGLAGIYRGSMAGKPDYDAGYSLGLAERRLQPAA